MLRTWFTTRGAHGIDFREVFDPEVDPYDSYRVAYEASFTPKGLDRARAEVWVTDDGFTSFGFERWSRVGERLGNRSGQDRFAAGIEPVGVSERQLQSLLDLTAGGEIRLKVTTLPLVGIVSVEAFVAFGTKERVGLGGSCFRWLRERSSAAGPFARILTYQPW
jgi:hypothetical protein